MKIKDRIERQATYLSSCPSWVYICFCLILIITYIVCYHALASKGTEVVITPMNERNEYSSGSRMTFRGVSADGGWYDADVLYVDGNWTFDEVQRTYSAKDMSSLTIRVPHASDTLLVFNAGPDRGMALVSADGFCTELDFYAVDEIETGVGYAFERDSSGLQRCQYAAAACALCAVAFYWIASVLYKKTKVHINWATTEMIFVALLLPIAIVFLYNLSLSSSPKVPEESSFYGYDAAIFRVVSNGWAAGKIPYRDLMESKGPLTFLIYMIGDCLSARWGLFAIQCFSLWISLLFCYKTGKEIAGPLKGMISAVVFLAFFPAVLDEGALTEEFNLPLLMISTYLVAKYFLHMKEEPGHPPIYAFVYGLTCGASLCFRLTNCLAICCYVFCITVFLIKEKHYKNVFRNAVGFITGGLLIVLPFCIYFIANNAFSDMLWGTLLFNFQYVADPIPHTAEQWRIILVYISPMLFCILFSLEKKGVFRAAIIMAAVVSSVMIVRCSLYPHYYIVHLTFVPIACCMFLQERAPFCPEDRRFRLVYAGGMLIIILAVFSQSWESASIKYQWIESLQDRHDLSSYANYVKMQSNMIPEDERDQVIGYNVPSDWYLISGIVPCTNYFNCQDQRGSLSPQVQDDILEFFRSNTAKWIVAAGDIGNSEIAELVNNNYEVYNTVFVDETGWWMTLYHRLV